jgi:hypothetical protein
VRALKFEKLTIISLEISESTDSRRRIDVTATQEIPT